MKTKNIFKTLALAILLMPAMLLTTSCSNEDDNLINNNSNNLKGYPLQVTVNVTRQGDEGTTRATYNESTKKLSFSSGDKLFVSGEEATAGQFAGTLDYDAVSGKFSGTIYTKNPYEDTADALFTAASPGLTFSATLLPNGYESTGFLYVATNGTVEKYDDQAAYNYNNAFALTKAAGVEQLSYEVAGSYSSGFTLHPDNPILYFTITGLPASTEVAVVFSYYAADVNKNVTTNSSGTATFAIGVPCSELADCTLAVGGNVITLGSHDLFAGTIYKITRSAAPAPTYTLLSAATTSDQGKVVCAAGHLHDAKTAVPAGCTAVGILGKVSSTGHGLILALQNATNQDWKTINGWTSVTTYASTTLKVLPDAAARGSLTSYTTLGETAVSNWAVAQKSDYEAIFTNLGSMKSDTYGTTYDDNVNAYITTGVGGTELSSGYFSATEHDVMPGFAAWAFTSDYWQSQMQTVSYSVRPVLGF